MVPGFWRMMSVSGQVQHISPMHMRAGMITDHIPLWLYWQTKKPKGRSLLLAMPSPLALFRDFVLFPSPCLPLWFSIGPLGSGRCTWGATDGLCQELEWSLYRLAFNVPPVPPCAIIGKPLSSLLWSTAFQSWLLPARQGAHKDLLGGCDAPFQSGSWIRAPLNHPPPASHAHTHHRDRNCM